MLVPMWSDQELQSELAHSVESGKYTLVDFWATWCAPCAVLAPKINEVASDPAYQDFRFLSVDIDKAPEAARRYMVMSVPTLILFDKEGMMVAHKSGITSRPAIDRLLRPYL